MHEDDLLAPWFEHLVGSLDHVSLFDFHTHIGVNDPDGFKLLQRRADRAARKLPDRAAR